MHSTTTLALFIIACFVGTVCSVDFQSNRQLGSMVYFLSGQNPHDFLNYGCWCGNKDRPTHAPLDELDQCCQIHQVCNKAINEKTDTALYPYKTSFEDGTIECMNNVQTKAHRQCECDLALAKCLKESQEVYTNNLLYLSDEKCSPGIVLNFDDLSTNGSSSQLPEDYHNLTIIGGSHMLANKYLPRPTGYATAMASPPNVLTSQRQMTIKRVDRQSFSVVSFSSAAAWNIDLQLNLIGSRQFSPVLFNRTVLLQAHTCSLIELNWSGIDTLIFNATGGKAYQPYGQYGDSHFAIDNLRLRL